MVAWLIIGGVMIIALLIIAYKSEHETFVTINSKYGVKMNTKGISRLYMAKKNRNTNGYDIEDWKFYDDNGDSITDNKLKTIIFGSFVNEDWYGDLTFFANDVTYLESDKKNNTIKNDSEVATVD